MSEYLTQGKASTESLEALRTQYRAVKTCVKCRLCETRSNAVFGEGSLDADIMFVGEAPGKDEDEQGRPFVGKSGQILRKAIKDSNIELDQIFITNVVKCRPPSNRDPQTDEIKACQGYLTAQIEKIDPIVIVTLGNFSTKLFLGQKANISQVRGNAYTIQGRTVCPVYHPAATIYDRSKKAIFEQDITRAIGETPLLKYLTS